MSIEKLCHDDPVGKQDAQVYYSESLMLAIYIVGKTHKLGEKIISEEFLKLMKNKDISGPVSKATYFKFYEGQYTIGIIRVRNQELFLQHIEEYAINIERVTEKHQLAESMEEANLLLSKQRADILPRNEVINKTPLCRKVLDFYTISPRK